VVHVDHGQHKQSKRTMSSLRARCRRWKIPFYGMKLEVPPGSSEELLRKERYQAFERLYAQHEYRRVATGHTLTDQVETVLMRILRGTGVAGLGGIPAVRGIFIRPLLECSREEILGYLKTRRLSWHEDPTNRSRKFLRNRIRLDLLPQLRKQANPSVDRALLRLSDAAARDNDLIESLLAQIQPDLSTNGTARLPLSLFDELHDSLAIRVLLKMLRCISLPGANLEKLHTDIVLAMIRRPHDPGNWRLDLPGGVIAGREGEVIYLSTDGPTRRKDSGG
jgi:tRNA(Ile)-lysidine synthase